IDDGRVAGRYTLFVGLRSPGGAHVCHIEQVLETVRNAVQARADVAPREVCIRACCLLEGEIVGDGDEVLQFRGQPGDAIEIKMGQLDAGDPLGAQPGCLFPRRGQCDIGRRGRKSARCRRATPHARRWHAVGLPRDPWIESDGRRYVVRQVERTNAGELLENGLIPASELLALLGRVGEAEESLRRGQIRLDPGRRAGFGSHRFARRPWRGGGGDRIGGGSGMGSDRCRCCESALASWFLGAYSGVSRLLPVDDTGTTAWFSEVLAHERDLRAFLTRYLPHRDDVSDVLQETYTRLLALSPERRSAVRTWRAFLF